MSHKIMSGFTVIEEHEFDVDLKPTIFHSSLNLPVEEHVFDCENTAETNITGPNQVECLIYCPDTEEATNEESNQEDPLAVAEEWVNFRPINVEDELLSLDSSNVPDAFSIVDPLEIGETKPVMIKTESTFAIDVEDTKPSVSQLEEQTRKHMVLQSEQHTQKRKAPPDRGLPLPAKKMNLRRRSHTSEFGLKELRVNIGPKLPLPKCFLRKMTSEAVKKELQLVKCTSCDFTCQEISELNDHVKEHPILKIFSCNNCNYKCTDKLSHEAHVATCPVSSYDSVLDQSMHNKTPRKGFYWCESCSFKFRSEQNLIIHEKRHLKKCIKCYICEMDLFTADRLRNHFRFDHNAKEMIFSCNVCQYSSVRYHHFKDHLMVHNTDKYLYCCQCKRNYENTTEINEHLLKVHKKDARKTTNVKINNQIIKSNLTVEEKLNKLKSNFMAKNILKNKFYHCNGCLYKFLKLENLLTHKKLHLNVSAPYKCSDCDFQSFCAIDIKNHLATHCQSKGTVECNVCKTLSSGRQIRQHAVFHVQDGLFCLSCYENFEDSGTYEKHLNVIHKTTLNKELSCDECSFKYLDSEALQMHKNRHHREQKQVSQPNICKGVFKCNKCKFEFSQIDMFERHDRFNHGGDKDLFVCSVCNWTTSSTKHYLRHMSTHGSKNVLLCCYCPCETYNETNFVKHLSEHNVKCCPYCVFKCGNFARLKSHFSRQHKPGNGRFSCSLCPYNTARKNNLNIHSITFHPKEFPSLKLPIPIRFLNSSSNGCGLCPFKAHRLNDIKRHVSRHFLKGLFNKRKYLEPSTSACIKQENAEVTNSTQIIPSSLSLYRCSQCLYSGKRRDNVVKHLLRQHNIRGGVRNHMIVKVDKSLLQNDENKREKFDKCKENKFNSEQELNDKGFLNKIADSDSGTVLNSQRIIVPKKKTLLLKQRFQSSAKNHLHKKKYACNMCQFSCNYSQGLTRHKSRHFSGGYISKGTKLKPFTNQIQPKLTSQGIQRVEQDIPQPIKDCTVYYSCSQCNFRSLDIKVVTLHLLDIHNIHGSLKNYMIIKINDKLNQKEESVVLDIEDGKNQPSKSDKLLGVSSGLKVKKMCKREKEQCFQCNIHLLSVRAQVEHNKLGHKGFWNKPFSCTRAKCGMRFTTKTSLVRHETKRCTERLTIKKIKNSKQQKNIKSFEHQKESEECNSIKVVERPVSDDESFSCGECDFITYDVTDLIKHMFVHTRFTDD